MTVIPHAGMRQLVVQVLTRRVSSTSGDEALVAAARSTYDDLSRVCSPLIGRVGVNALTTRALYLARQEHSWLIDGSGPEHAKDPFIPVLASLAAKEPDAATEAAAAVLALLVGLLVTFIGKPLTASLIRQAWPEAFPDAHTQEM